MCHFIYCGFLFFWLKHLDQVFLCNQYSYSLTFCFKIYMIFTGNHLPPGSGPSKKKAKHILRLPVMFRLPEQLLLMVKASTDCTR